MIYDGVIAVGLLTRRDLDILGPTFKRVWPADETPCFSQMFRAIDEAERALRQSRESDEPARQ